MSSQIKKGAILSYIAIFLNIAISFFYTPWMIRQIGVSDYGLYSLVMSFISYFILDLGLTQTVQRFIAKYRAEGDLESVQNLIGLTTKIFLIIDIIIFLILAVCYFFLGQIFTGLTPEEVEKLKVLYCIAGTFSVLSFMFKPLGGTIMAFELFTATKWIGMLNKVGAVILVCIALLFGADVYALVFINGAMALLASILKYVVFRRKTGLHINWSYYDRGKVKEVFSFSMWAFGNGVAQRMRLTLVPTVLGIMSNSAEISIFALGMTLEAMVFTLSAAINGLFLPRVSLLTVNKDIKAIETLMIKVGRLQFYLMALIFTGFVIFGRQFLNLWVEPQFEKTYYVVICLIFTHLVTLTQRIADDYIYVENRIKDSSIRMLTCSFIGLVISALLAPRFGAVGCGIGTGTGLILYAVSINVFYSKGMNLNMKEFFKGCHLRILPLIAVLSVVTYLVVSHLNLTSWTRLLPAIFSYMLLFGAVSYFCLFNKEEKSLFRSLMPHQHHE